MEDINFSTVFDQSSCVRRGLCPVTDITDPNNLLESHSLYYEEHGSGPEKLLFINGLNSSSFSWSGQVERFGKSGKYSVLVFDNRGVGHSGSPRGPYTTSGMAQDVITLLDYVGWTQPRDLHVIGISLGGMIAQELAFRIPERIVSLLLSVTTPGGRPWSNIPPWKGLKLLTRATFTADFDKKLPVVLDMVFPSKWLDSQTPDGRTNREIQTEEYVRRFAATRPMTLVGSMCQMCAALTHYVSPSRLARISSSIPKVVILTGDQDLLVYPSNSIALKNSMNEAELVQWKETGHGVHLQRADEYNELIERMVVEGRERASVEVKTKAT